MMTAAMAKMIIKMKTANAAISVVISTSNAIR